MELTENESSVLKLSLKDRSLPPPEESEVVVIVDDIWDQTLQKDILNED